MFEATLIVTYIDIYYIPSDVDDTKEEGTDEEGDSE